MQDGSHATPPNAPGLRVRVARNQRLAAPDERLAAGDEPQLIPPLAGG